MADGATFLATIYRDIRFDQDGGGKVTLQFDAKQEAHAVRLLMLRARLLSVTIQVVESYAEGKG